MTTDRTDANDGFARRLAEWPVTRVREIITAATEGDVTGALRSGVSNLRGFASLLSPAAEPFLEQAAQKAAVLTRQRFGRVLQFYVPLYVSNYCVNACVYCGFNCRNRVARCKLTVDEAVSEAEFLAAEGFQHLLLVAGEDRNAVPVEYFEELIGRLHGRFASLNIEIYPLATDEYARLVRAGLDTLTLYQETYDPAIYREVHAAGPKRNFAARLGAIERGAQAGVSFLGIGALLGLADWRVDAFYVGLHAQYLQQHYWRQHVSISFPRLRAAAGGYNPPFPVSDRAFVQIMTAQRLFLPDAGMVLSTREPAQLRDHLLALGVTRLSAGSRTTPGGYAHESGAEQQFEVLDHRSLAEMRELAMQHGFDPVCKDWDAAYHDGNLSDFAETV
jgi:2-iminoacetate synthase